MYTVFKNADVYDVVSKYHDAEHLAVDLMGSADSSDNNPDVYTIRNDAGIVLNSFTHRRIIGTILKEAPSGGEGVALVSVTFDATARVCSLPYAVLLGLQDGEHSIDTLTARNFARESSASVRIIERICEGFGVVSLEEITEPHFASVQHRRGEQYRQLGARLR